MRLAIALGDDARAKSIYITLRAAKMQESATAGDKLAKRANAEKEKHEKSENRKRMRAAALAVELAAQAAESDAVKARNAEDMENGLLWSFVTQFLRVILVGSLLGPPIVWIMCGDPPKSGPLVMLVCSPKRSPDHERQKTHDGTEDPHFAGGRRRQKHRASSRAKD